MKKNNIYAIALLLALSLTSCKDKTETTAPEGGVQETTPADMGQHQAPAGGETQTEPKPGEQKMINGKVLTTQATDKYTFMEVTGIGGTIWVAAQKSDIAVNDEIEFVENQPMVNFFSKTLDKTFEKIYFVASLKVNGKWFHASPEAFAAVAPGGAAALTGGAGAPETNAPIAVAAGSVKKADGGYTIEELFQKKEELVGKNIKVRGKVQKFLTGIMGKNWIHLVDGTGAKGTNDLTMTTADTVKVGDTVVATGDVVVAKDFGAGYKYDLLIENTKATVE